LLDQALHEHVDGERLEAGERGRASIGHLGDDISLLR
jgi:hypothetical protein